MIIAWFSCGATSAVACKMALRMYDDVRVIYIDTGSHHPDNVRFKSDCENWFGCKIEERRSERYNNVAEVLRKGFINSPHGAACTLELKKKVRYQIEKEVRIWDGQVWGFDFCEREINRAIRFKEQNPSTKPLFPLIENHITKEGAMAMLHMVGIEIPAMYQLGYSNNNCIGCPKGGMGYWNKIRVDFPDKFTEIAKIEREIGATCLKDSNSNKIYLDELEPNRGLETSPIIPDCDLFCQIEFQNIIDKRVSDILTGKLSINEVA